MAHWRTCLDGDGRGGRFLSWREVARTTGLSRTTAWRLQKRDEFPAPYLISPGRVGYREDEVAAWCASRGPSGPRRGRPPATAPGTGLPARAPAGADPNPPPSAEAVAPQPAGATPPSPPVPRERPPRRSQHAKAIAQQMRFDF